MQKNLFRLEKLKTKTIDTTIKDIRKVFRLKKKAIKDKMLRDIRIASRIEKEHKVIKDIIVRDIRILFENEEVKNCYKPVRVSSFQSSSFIECKSNGNRKRILSVEEYLNKIRTYLKDIINNLEKFDTWKTQLTIANDFSSSKEFVMHSK